MPGLNCPDCEKPGLVTGDIRLMTVYETAYPGGRAAPVKKWRPTLMCIHCKPINPKKTPCRTWKLDAAGDFDEALRRAVQIFINSGEAARRVYIPADSPLPVPWKDPKFMNPPPPA